MNPSKFCKAFPDLPSKPNWAPVSHPWDLYQAPVPEYNIITKIFGLQVLFTL